MKKEVEEVAQSQISVSKIVQMPEDSARISQEDVIRQSQQTEQILQSVVCPVCLMLLPMPHYICQECDNTFCPPCLNSWWAKNPDTCIYKCENAHFKTVKRSNTYNALMELLKMECRYCQTPVPVANAEKHDSECPLKVVECQNQGCKEEIRRKDVQQHKEECLYQIQKCRFCGALLYRMNMTKHQDQDCYQRQVECPHEGCPEKLKAADLEDHVSDCTYVPADCKWCGQSVPIKEIKIHMTDCSQRKMTCKWCQSTLEGAQCEKHKAQCAKRQLTCQICDQYFLASQMADHKNECMMREMLAMKRIQKKLLMENTQLKMVVTQLQNQVRELSTKNQLGGFNALIKVREDELKALKKDLFRLDNGISNLQKLRISELTAHQKKPHLSSALCPFCTAIKKKFEEQFAPLNRQRAMLKTRIEEVQKVLEDTMRSKIKAMDELKL